jgi:hypothetical protein
MVGGQNLVESKLPGRAALQLVERGECGVDEVISRQEGAATIPAQGLRLSVIMSCCAMSALEGHKVWIGHTLILPDQSVRVTFFKPRGVSTSRPFARVR